MQGFHSEIQCAASWKEDKAEGQECYPGVGWTSFIRPETSPIPDLVASGYDVVLSAVQTKQSRAPGVLQKLQSSLVKSMGEAEASIKKQERQGYLLSRCRFSGANRGECGLECFSSQSALDTNHTLQSCAEQERGDDSWSWVQYTQHTTGSPTNNNREHRHGLECRGGENIRKPERVTRGRLGIVHGHAAEIGNSGCQASIRSQKTADAWTAQSPDQGQDPIDKCGQENRGARSRMVKLRPKDYGEGQAACGDVSVVQSRSSRSLQQQVGGALNVEERDDRSLLVLVGTSSHRGAQGTGCGCGGTDPCTGRSHRHRECGWRSGFDRRHGRRGSIGREQHCSQQELAQKSQAFQGCSLSDESGKSASQAESSGCERHESQGESAQSIVSINSAVDSPDQGLMCDISLNEKRMLNEDLEQHFAFHYTWSTHMELHHAGTEKVVYCTGCGTHSSQCSVHRHEKDGTWSSRKHFEQAKVVHVGGDDQASLDPVLPEQVPSWQDSGCPCSDSESFELSDVILRSQNAATKRNNSPIDRMMVLHSCENDTIEPRDVSSTGEGQFDLSSIQVETQTKYSWELHDGAQCDKAPHEYHIRQSSRECEPQSFADGSSLNSHASLLRVRGEDNTDLFSSQGNGCKSQKGKFEPQHFVVGAFTWEKEHASLLRVRGEDNTDLFSSQGNGCNSQKGKFEPQHFVAGAFTWEKEHIRKAFSSQNLQNTTKIMVDAEHECEWICDHAGKETESPICRGAFSSVLTRQDTVPVRNKRRHRRVHFCDEVEVRCFMEHAQVDVTLHHTSLSRSCRMLWHLHGQIAYFHDFARVLCAVGKDFQCTGSPADMREKEDGRAIDADDHPQHISNIANADDEDSGCLTWPDEIDAENSRLPIFADTWFVSPDRFPLCVRPRKVQLHADFKNDPHALKQLCRKVWLDVDDGRSVEFHILTSPPTRLPSIKFHIVMLQGDLVGYEWTMLHSMGLPPLFRYRIVLFPEGMKVEDFFRQAQVEGACEHNRITCYLSFHEHGDEITINGQQRVRVPPSRYVEGAVRVIEDVSDSDDHSEPASEAETMLPMDNDNQDDEFSLMSAGPILFQFEDDDPYPWQVEGFLELEEQEMQQEQQPPEIVFAHHHQGLLQDEIADITAVQEEEDAPWVAATFGLGLVDLGRRDIEFQPHNLPGLLQEILRVWQDHAQYANLVVYNVHPQPIDVIGRRAVALIVVVDLPEALDISVRNVLVVEQAAQDVTVRRQPYAARLTSEASQREVLAQLDLHRNCPPFALRPCHVRLGEVFMEKNVFYDFDHGTLCRTWIGQVHAQVTEAEQSIYGVENFFLQVHSYAEQREEIENVQRIVCRVHGITPGNRPMGHRDIVIEMEWLYDLDWIRQMQTLWPFDSETVALYFAPSATADMNEVEEVVFHFIAKCGYNPGHPILVHQQLVSVEETPRDPTGINEYWAISIPDGWAGSGIVTSLAASPFWFEYARQECIYPHLAVNGVRMRDVRNVWQPGDVLRARFLVWQRHHMLTLLLGAHNYETSKDVEFTSFLQQRSTLKKGEVGHQQSETSESAIDDQSIPHSDSFIEVCQSLRDAGIQALNDDAGVERIQTQSQGASFAHECCPTEIDVGEEASSVDLRGEEEKGNGISELDQTLQTIYKKGLHGINQDFMMVPYLHPHARIACEWVPPGTHHGHVWHIFTDGSAKNEKATWAIVIIKEVLWDGRHTFVRVGYAAGDVTEDLGPVDQNAMDAEATAIIAMVEYALANCVFPESHVYCHFDAMAVGFGATGIQGIPQQKGSTSTRQKAARILMTILEKQMERKKGSCEGLHVCAHQGHPWNEMADGLAKAVWHGWQPQNHFTFASGALLQHPLAEWAWLQVAPNMELPSLSHLLRNEDPMQNVHNIDATLLCKPVKSSHRELPVALKFATANVATMAYEKDRGDGVSLKAMEILRQFEETKVHIIGVQESRAKRSQCIESGPYTRLIAAGDGGHAGVELWINGQEIAKAFKTVFAPGKDLCVWHQSARVLGVRCNFGAIAFDVLVLYAPQGGRPSEEIQQWWHELQKVISKRDANVALFCLGDMNCKIGSIVTEGIGEHGADIEDLGGTNFREFCEANQLIVPSTFDQWHQGPSDTFVSAHNTKSRLDYIAVSSACQAGVVQSYVDSTIDLMNGDRDHRPVILVIEIQHKQNEVGRMRKRNIYDRKAARQAKDQAGCSLLDTFPLQPWFSDVNEHWSMMRQHMQDGAAKWYPCPKRKQRQLYFSEHTWNLLCDRKDLRQQHREIQRQINLKSLAKVFQAWKTGQAEYRDALWELDMSMLCQQDAILLEARRSIDDKFRKHKKQDWKACIEYHLTSQISQANAVSPSKLYQILQPKKMIAKHCGKLTKPLPGLRKEDGEWHFSRSSVADGWQRQFGQIENAETVAFEELLDRSKPLCGPRSIQNLQEIPTLIDVEKALRSLNDDKAAGLDGLGAELFKGECAKVARRVYPLVLKTGLRCQGVAELSGGWLLPLFKGKGSTQQMLGYRAILLEPVIARAISKAWRPKLVRGLQNTAMPMQWGGRAGLSVEALHLQVQLWQANARRQKMAHGLIFIDIKSAFYSVVKQLLTCEDGSGGRLREVFTRMRLPDSVWDTFVDNVERCDLIQQATGSAMLAKSTQAMLSHSWFAIPDAGSVSAPMTGSRPGDPGADLLFGLLMSKVLQTVHIRSSQAGMPLFPGEDNDMVTSQCVTWVDDVAISITSAADKVVGQVTHTCFHWCKMRCWSLDCICLLELERPLQWSPFMVKDPPKPDSRSRMIMGTPSPFCRSIKGR